MKKLTERTYGAHIYMKLELSGEVYEVDCYFRDNGTHYRTTADGTPKREEVINAFNQLY